MRAEAKGSGTSERLPSEVVWIDFASATKRNNSRTTFFEVVCAAQSLDLTEIKIIWSILIQIKHQNGLIFDPNTNNYIEQNSQIN
jgi:hypothetical protein